MNTPPHPSHRADAPDRLLTFTRAVFEKWAVVEEHEKGIYRKAGQLLREVGCEKLCLDAPGGNPL